MPGVRTQAQAAGSVGHPSAEPGARGRAGGGTHCREGRREAGRSACPRENRWEGPCQAIRKQAGLQVHASEDPQARPAQGSFHRPLPPPWTPAWPRVQPIVEASSSLRSPCATGSHRRDPGTSWEESLCADELLDRRCGRCREPRARQAPSSHQAAPRGAVGTLTGTPALQAPPGPHLPPGATPFPRPLPSGPPR